jgi:8-oxo-dGTP pyrophosphatase MutT (NUDIX family)
VQDDVQFSAGGIVFHEGQLLLIEARRTSRWQLPKGHLERGETPQQAAVREIQEETGAAVTVVEPAGEVEYRFRGPHGRWIFKHVDFYLCAFARQVSERCDPTEVKRAAWHPWDRALEMLAFDNERELVRSSLERLLRPGRRCTADAFGLGALDTVSSSARLAPRADVEPATSAGTAHSASARQPRGDTDGPEEIP